MIELPLAIATSTVVALAQPAPPPIPVTPPPVTTDASPPSDQPAPPPALPPPPPVVTTVVPPPATPAAQATTQAVVPFASLEDGMGMRSADDEFSLSLHLLTQLRYAHVEREGGRDDGFRAVLVRPALRGAAFRPWIQYFVQFELAGTPALLDAEIIVHPIPEIGLKVGQFLTPFSREFLVPPGALLFPDFAPSNVLFRDNRDTGAMLFGGLFRRHVEYFLAAVNGNGINQGGNDNAEPEWIGRLVATVIGKNAYTEIPQLVDDDVSLSFGAGGSHSQTEQTATSVNPTTGATTTARLGSTPTTKLGADVALHAGPVSLQAEAYARTIGSGGGVSRSVARGGFAQLGVFVVPKTLEVAARGDVIELASNRGLTNERVDGGLVYYVRENHLKLQLAYAWTSVRAPDASAPAAVAHGVTAQAQLWF